uniref:Cytochrome c oxidase subunit 2 n=1 Tax=Gyrodactylus scleromystaci TaxID=1448048 RepID=A0A4Y5QMW4_9PLAT|nr:cytochrome c oxidase subunit II [Gyrodactylus scleromystaci]QCX36138.1 cytochrome c oxidase subunit II [Gyrodactylus scleromystaci]QCX36139.1 cytochrome c oxidase subunit II [Gyrodactylus scleromystaci]
MSLSLIYYDIVSYVVMLCFFMCVLTVFYLLFLGFFSGNVILNKEFNNLEFKWTFIPSLFMSILCYLNLSFFYFDSELDTISIVKVMGRQWYWSYEDSFKGLYDSYHLSSLINSVDNPLVLTYNSSTRILMSSSDVLHSFSVPDLGLKMDAVPGRVNHLTYLPTRVGSFMGYCSELCGVGHSYMPNHY